MFIFVEYTFIHSLHCVCVRVRACVCVCVCGEREREYDRHVHFGLRLRAFSITGDILVCVCVCVCVLEDMWMRMFFSQLSVFQFPVCVCVVTLNKVLYYSSICTSAQPQWERLLVCANICHGNFSLYTYMCIHVCACVYIQCRVHVM